MSSENSSVRAKRGREEGGDEDHGTEGRVTVDNVDPPVNDGESPPECSICLDTVSLPINVGCHLFCLLCIKSVVSTSVTYSYHSPRCPLCRRELDVDLLDHSQMATDEWERLHGGGKDQFVWKYAGRSSGWWLFDDKSNRMLEEEYQKYSLWQREEIIRKDAEERERERDKEKAEGGDQKGDGNDKSTLLPSSVPLTAASSPPPPRSPSPLTSSEGLVRCGSVVIDRRPSMSMKGSEGKEENDQDKQYGGKMDGEDKAVESDNDEGDESEDDEDSIGSDDEEDDDDPPISMPTLISQIQGGYSSIRRAIGGAWPSIAAMGTSLTSPNPHRVIVLTIGHKQYGIDFLEMRQWDVADPLKSRKIIRSKKEELLEEFQQGKGRGRDGTKGQAGMGFKRSRSIKRTANPA